MRPSGIETLLLAKLTLRDNHIFVHDEHVKKRIVPLLEIVPVHSSTCGRPRESIHPIKDFEHHPGALRRARKPPLTLNLFAILQHEAMIPEFHHNILLSKIQYHSIDILQVN